MCVRGLKGYLLVRWDGVREGAERVFVGEMDGVRKGAEKGICWCDGWCA